MLATLSFSPNNKWKTALQIGLGLLLLIFLGWLLFDVWRYLLISLVIATILRPLVDYISEIYVFRVKIPRVLAVLVAMVAMVAFVTLFVRLFFPLISDQLRLLRSIEPNVLSLQITEPIENLENFLIEELKVNAQKGFILEELNTILKTFLEKFDIAGMLNSLVGVAGSVFVYLLAITFMTFLLLYEKGLFRKMVISAIPNRYFEVLITAFYKIEHLLSNYLRGILIETLAVFTIYAVGGILLNIPYALTIAALAASINFIPYLGPFSGFAFGILVIVTNSFSVPDFPLSLKLIKFISLFFAVRLIDDIFLQPFIFSKSVKAHPLEIFIVIFSGASLAGAVGMIVAIPTYTIIKVSIKELRKGFRRYRSFR
ncbi:AI-2E family transporter [Raineya orbicola]|jgi:predicted PurR-regulated permease PerM|uniref:Putative permease n=1 Tax=Raineya orbicola TaxID=2016530 RepID=A0A2N3IJV2_9BACT|nr:AI-2E family transporter [Raineya orbicola]PKQ70551.1 putative permease [Raineya orbicola]